MLVFRKVSKKFGLHPPNQDAISSSPGWGLKHFWPQWPVEKSKLRLVILGGGWGVDPTYGCFLKWWVSPTNPWVFLLKAIILGCEMGVPPFKETTIYNWESKGPTPPKGQHPPQEIAGLQGVFVRNHHCPFIIPFFFEAKQIWGGMPFDSHEYRKHNEFLHLSSLNT